LNWACGVEGEADPAPVRADADVAVEKVVACLAVLDRTFVSFRHVLDRKTKLLEVAAFLDQSFTK